MEPDRCPPLGARPPWRECFKLMRPFAGLPSAGRTDGWSPAGDIPRSLLGRWIGRPSPSRRLQAPTGNRVLVGAVRLRLRDSTDPAFFRGSSNGRTPASGAGDLGSSPSPRFRGSSTSQRSAFPVHVESRRLLTHSYVPRMDALAGAPGTPWVPRCSAT